MECALELDEFAAVGLPIRRIECMGKGRTRPYAVKRSFMRSHLWLGLGLLSTGCGIVGVFLPLLPTTPFLLLAAFCFGRSSPRLHAWLLNHPRYGRLIADWEKYGAINLRAKVLALALMAGSFLITLYLALPTWALIAHGVMIAGAGTFVATRPLPPSP